jgi:NMD protein affecting ribosome stability and mRNA decay
MANCSKCGTKVGCGCQLTNGMCAACNSAKNNTTNVTQQTNTQNAPTQAIKLS